MAMSNAQRQARWRERHIRGDLFPPLSEYEFPKVSDRYVTVSVLGSLDPKTIELLRCPFCDGLPCVVVKRSSYMVSNAIFCKLCDCVFENVASLDDLVVKWNRRA